MAQGNESTTQPINSVASAKAAFPALKWRDDKNCTKGAIAVVFCGGDRETGDIIVFLAMENGAEAPWHVHKAREGWPFRETITCFAGEMHGTNSDDPTFVLRAGMTIDLTDGTRHKPFVLDDGFALVSYRQPAGSMLVAPPPSEP